MTRPELRDVLDTLMFICAIVFLLAIFSCSSTPTKTASMTWDKSEAADSYRVYLSLVPGAKKNAVNDIYETKDAFYIRNRIEIGKTYYIQITAKNPIGESDPSDEIEFKP